MIGYVCLSVALLAGLGKGYIGKRISFDVTSLKDSIFVNLLRCVFCAVIGFFMVLLTSDGAKGLVLTPWEFGVCTFSSVAMTVFYVSWLYAYQRGAYMFLNMFTMLGAVVTGLLGLVVYHESIRPLRLVAMALLVVAVYVMSLYNADIKGKLTPLSVFILVIGGLGSALADFSQKVYRQGGGDHATAFTFYTYLIAVVLQLVVWGAMKMQKTQTGNAALKDGRHVLIYLLLSVCLYLNSFTKTVAVGLLPASQMYPLLQGGNLICSAVMAAVLMKELPNRKSVIGIAIALAAVVLMNV